MSLYRASLAVPPFALSCGVILNSSQTHPSIDASKAVCLCAAVRRLHVHVFRSCILNAWLLSWFFFLEWVHPWMHLCICSIVCVRRINRWSFWNKLSIIPAEMIHVCSVCFQQWQTTPEVPSADMFSYETAAWNGLPHTALLSNNTHTQICIQFGF